MKIVKRVNACLSHNMTGVNYDDPAIADWNEAAPTMFRRKKRKKNKKGPNTRLVHFTLVVKPARFSALRKFMGHIIGIFRWKHGA